MYASRVGLGVHLLSSSTLLSRRGLVPAMSLNFLSGYLDSRVTFTRGSNATLVDSTGRVTYAPANLLLASQEFDNAVWSKAAVTVTANTTAAPDGTLTADTLQNTVTTGARIQRAFAAILSVTYIYSCYLKAGTANGGITLSDGGGSVYASLKATLTGAGSVTVTGTGATGSIVAVADGWYRVSLVWPATVGGAVFGSIGPWDGSPDAFGYPSAALNKTVIAWGGQIEPVTYQTSAGTYNATTPTTAYYGPRFDYDPVTLAPRGLLIEEQRANLLTYSEQFNDAAWVKSNTTISANAVVAPDGAATADAVIENTANSTHWVGRNISASASTSYTASIFVKAAGRTAGQFQIFGNSGGSTVSFNLSTGTSTAAGAYGGWTSASTTITNFGNGWYRITNTATTNAGLTSLDFRVFLENPAGTPSYTGDGTSGIYLWGAQLEAGAFATSYIPTVASTATRSADVATMTGTNFTTWYNGTEGTFIVEWQSTNPSVYRLIDGQNVVGRLALLRDASAFYWDKAGTGAQSSRNNGLLSTAQKGAGAYSASDNMVALNGALGSVSAGTGLAYTQMSIGSSPTSGNVINGHIRQIAYYNSRLPNAQLQSLTA